MKHIDSFPVSTKSSLSQYIALAKTKSMILQQVCCTKKDQYVPRPQKQGHGMSSCTLLTGRKTKGKFITWNSVLSFQTDFSPLKTIRVIPEIKKNLKPEGGPWKKNPQHLVDTKVWKKNPQLLLKMCVHFIHDHTSPQVLHNISVQNFKQITFSETSFS